MNLETLAMASQTQFKAKQNNTLKSTAPKFITGRQVVPQTAVKYGFLSTQTHRCEAALLSSRQEGF